MKLKTLLQKISIGWGLLFINLFFILGNILIFALSGVDSYEKAKPFFLKKNTIQKIQIQYLKNNEPQEAYVLQLNNHTHQDKKFYLVKGEESYFAVQKVVKEFIEKLYDLRKFTELKLEKEKYGFSKGEFKIQIHWDDPKANPSIIYLAKDQDSQGNSYIIWEDKVYLIPFGLYPLNQREPIKEFLKKGFLPEDILDDSIQSLELEQGGKKQFSFVQSNGNWYPMGNTSRVVDLTKLKNYLKLWKDLKSSDVFFSNEIPKDWKIVPKIKIQVGILNPEGLPKSIQWSCGWEDKMGDSICYSHEDNLYFKYYSYDINPIIQKKEDYFLNE